jgi:hypothetical protein
MQFSVYDTHIKSLQKNCYTPYGAVLLYGFGFKGVVRPKKRGIESSTNQIAITLHTIPRSYGSGSRIWNPVLFDPWLWNPG